MGMITSSRLLDDGNILFRVVLEQDEALALKSHVNNIHLFAADLCDREINIIKKGRKGVTVYFGIPLSLRKKGRDAFGELSCQKLEFERNSFFIYVLEKKVQLDKI